MESGDSPLSTLGVLLYIRLDVGGIRIARLAFDPTLETSGDRFGLGAATTWATLPLALRLRLRLRPTVRAVGIRLGLFRLDPRWGFSARFQNSVGNRLGDQLDRADRIVVSGNRHRNEIRIGVRIDDRHDRDRQLVALVDGDALLLRIDDEHEARRSAHVPNAVEVLHELVLFPRQHELLFLRVVLEVSTRLGTRFE